MAEFDFNDGFRTSYRTFIPPAMVLLRTFSISIVILLLKLTGDPSFLPCPRTLAQALADSGRYTADEHCNPKSTDECPLYHVSASFCVRSIRPR